MIVREILQMKLFSTHKEISGTLPVPMCYRPSDSGRQNIEVGIPGQTEKKILVLNDIVLVDIGVVDHTFFADKSK